MIILILGFILPAAIFIFIVKLLFDLIVNVSKGAKQLQEVAEALKRIEPKMDKLQAKEKK